MKELRERILGLIYDCVDEINRELPEDTALEKNPGTVLLGPGGTLDSLGLVNLIVATEERIEQQLGKSVTIADEKAMSLKNSPFRTIGTLADYAGHLVEDTGDV